MRCRIRDLLCHRALSTRISRDDLFKCHSCCALDQCHNAHARLHAARYLKAKHSCFGWDSSSGIARTICQRLIFKPEHGSEFYLSQLLLLHLVNPTSLAVSHRSLCGKRLELVPFRCVRHGFCRASRRCLLARMKEQFEHSTPFGARHIRRRAEACITKQINSSGDVEPTTPNWNGNQYCWCSFLTDGHNGNYGWSNVKHSRNTARSVLDSVRCDQYWTCRQYIRRAVSSSKCGCSLEFFINLECVWPPGDSERIEHFRLHPRRRGAQVQPIHRRSSSRRFDE